MQIGDLEKWSIDQLKKEVVRLSTVCEKKQHEILHKNEKINELYAELDKMFAYNNKLIRQVNEKADTPFYDESAEIAKCHRQHQSDCVTINQLHTTLDVLIDRYANLRKIHGAS